MSLQEFQIAANRERQSLLAAQEKLDEARKCGTNLQRAMTNLIGAYSKYTDALELAREVGIALPTNHGVEANMRRAVNTGLAVIGLQSEAIAPGERIAHR